MLCSHLSGSLTVSAQLLLLVHSAGAEFTVVFTCILYGCSFWFRVPGRPYGIAENCNIILLMFIWFGVWEFCSLSGKFWTKFRMNFALLLSENQSLTKLLELVQIVVTQLSTWWQQRWHYDMFLLVSGLRVTFDGNTDDSCGLTSQVGKAVTCPGGHWASEETVELYFLWYFHLTSKEQVMGKLKPSTGSSSISAEPDPSFYLQCFGLLKLYVWAIIETLILQDWIPLALYIE